MTNDGRGLSHCLLRLEFNERICGLSGDYFWRRGADYRTRGSAKRECEKVTLPVTELSSLVSRFHHHESGFPRLVRHLLNEFRLTPLVRYRDLSLLSALTMAESVSGFGVDSLHWRAMLSRNSSTFSKSCVSKGSGAATFCFYSITALVS